MNNHSYLQNLPQRSQSPQNTARGNSRWLKIGMCLLILLALTLFSPAAFSMQKDGRKGAGKERKEREEQPEQGKPKMLVKQRGEASKPVAGATISGNSMKLQSGYQFVKQLNGNLAVQRANGGISGEFKCSCKKTTTQQSSCDFSTIGGTTATCNNNECNDCLLETVVKGGGKAAAVAAVVGKNDSIWVKKQERPGPAPLTCKETSLCPVAYQHKARPIKRMARGGLPQQ